MHEPGALTYVVLDVPEPQASAVMAVREANGDVFRAALPVEVTLTDSIDPSQDAPTAFAALDAIAATTRPIATRFAGPHRFPGSDTFVMRLADDEPFRLLRDRVVGSGVKFESPSGYDFIPHCTLRTRSPVTDDEADALLRTHIGGEFVLDTLSVYTLSRAATPAGVEFELRHRAQLAAA